MIDPKYLQELIILGISVEVAPSELYDHFRVIVKKEQKHPDNSTIIGTIRYEQILSTRSITNTEKITDCVKFMVNKVFKREQNQIDK